MEADLVRGRMVEPGRQPLVQMSALDDLAVGRCVGALGTAQGRA